MRGTPGIRRGRCRGAPGKGGWDAGEEESYVAQIEHGSAAAAALTAVAAEVKMGELDHFLTPPPPPVLLYPYEEANLSDENLLPVSSGFLIMIITL